MRRSALLAFLLIAGCVSAPPEPVTHAVSAPPVPVAVQVPAVDWRDWPRTPGDWRYSRDGYSTLATYGATGVVLSCDNDRRVRLRLDGRATLAPITIRTTSVSRATVPGVLGHPPTGIAMAFSATDPLLDAIAFSRGRFTIEQAGAAPLVLPAWAEVGRVIEDCRG